MGIRMARLRRAMLDMALVVACVALACEAAPLSDSAAAAADYVLGEATSLGEAVDLGEAKKVKSALAKADLKHQVLKAVNSIKKSRAKLDSRAKATAKIKKVLRKEKKETRHEVKKTEKVLAKQSGHKVKRMKKKAKKKERKIEKKELAMHRPSADDAAGWITSRKGGIITAENPENVHVSVKATKDPSSAAHCAKCHSMCKTGACKSWCQMRWCQSKKLPKKTAAKKAKATTKKVESLICRGCSMASGARRNFCKEHSCY